MAFWKARTAPLLITAAAFCVLLFVLHGAQPLAVKGPKLDPNSFATEKKARYRIILRGPVEQPIRLSLRDEGGNEISSVATFTRAEAKVLKARRNVARASVAPSVGIEIRMLDEHALVRRWIATLLFLATLLWFCLIHREHRWAQAFALGSVYFLFLIPWELPAAYAFSSDSRYYIPAGLSLLHSGDWNVDEFGGSDPTALFANDYRVRQSTDGHWYDLFPPGTTILSLPVILAGNWLYDETPSGWERVALIFSLTGKLLSAATVALFFLVVIALTRRRLALLLTLVFAFATPQLGIHGGGLWSHSASVFCTLVALGLWIWKEGRFAAWAAIPLAFGFACRPTMFIPGIVLGLALLFRNRKTFALFSLLALLCAIPFFYYSLGISQSVLPPYYTGHAGSPGNFGWEAYLGSLISPSRGLFVYCPVLLFALLGGAIAFRRSGPGKIYLLASLICLFEWIVGSHNGFWWGGHCYGPRLLCELVPFGMLLLIPAWESIERHSARRFFILLGLATCAWGVFVEAQALANPAVYEWNATPNVDFHPERLWDWRDWQILAGH